MTMIPQPTRSAARKMIKDLKCVNKDCKLVDKGSHLKGSDRWFIQVRGLKSTLTAPVKPCNGLLYNKRKTVQKKAITSRNYLQNLKGCVYVVYKRKLHNV